MKQTGALARVRPRFGRPRPEGHIGQKRRPGQPNLTQSFGVERLNYHPGDWRKTPLMGQFWNHLTATRKDVQMLIKYERVEMEKFRAEQCRDYFNKLVHIARKRVEQPNYSGEQLAWWCGEGGTPANHFVHERFEEKPLVKVPGMEEKLLAITERTFDKNVASFQLIGHTDLKHTVYAGEGWANGLGQDPETTGFPYCRSQRDMGIVEVIGHPYGPLPLPRLDERNLESLLVKNLTG